MEFNLRGSVHLT